MRDCDDELIRNIKPDVLQVLNTRHFFVLLDDRMCPDDPAQPAQVCHGNHAISESILRDMKFDAEDTVEVIGVLRSEGGGCDCEILYNVANESRLRSKYWKSRAKDLKARHAGTETPPNENDQVNGASSGISR